MSGDERCGGQGEVDCAEVLAEVYLLLDHECSSKEHEELLRKHLDDCPPCLEQYGLDEQIKQLLARKCGGEHAPDELKERLRESIRQTVAERGGVVVERSESSETGPDGRRVDVRQVRVEMYGDSA